MNMRVTVSADGQTMTVHVPMTFKKRGGRKAVVTPDIFALMESCWAGV